MSVPQSKMVSSMTLGPKPKREKGDPSTHLWVDSVQTTIGILYSRSRVKNHHGREPPSPNRSIPLTSRIDQPRRGEKMQVLAFLGPRKYDEVVTMDVFDGIRACDAKQEQSVSDGSIGVHDDERE